MTELERLEELLGKATRGPWSARIGGEYADDVWVASDAEKPWESHMALKLWSRTMGRGDYEIGSPEHKAAVANAHLLVAAVNALPKLIEIAKAAEPFAAYAGHQLDRIMPRYIAEDDATPVWGDPSGEEPAIHVGDLRKLRAALFSLKEKD